LADAINVDKTPIKAFLAWSLLDNFEWLTYKQRFGLIHFERGNDASRNNSLTRTVKKSFGFLRDHFKTNAQTPFTLPATKNDKVTPISSSKKTAPAEKTSSTARSSISWVLIVIPAFCA
jgi:hypothetical protein